MTPVLSKFKLHASHNDLLNAGKLRPGLILPLGKGHVGLAQSEQQPDVHREPGGLFWRQWAVEKPLAKRSGVGNSETVDAGTGD